MSRIAVLSFGLTGYAVFLATFLYLIGFVTGFCVPRTADAGGAASEPATAILIDIGLIALFGVQHSIMARPRFKHWLARFVPDALERTLFMLATCVVFAVMFWAWRPIAVQVWSLPQPLASIVLGLGFVGWAVVLLSTFLIDHFDLFGLRQTWLAFRGQAYAPRRFQERSLYRVVRHPLMLGFLLAFWAAPTMTGGRLVFAASYTAYILLALVLEERDLVAQHGPAYRDYQQRVPRLLPWRRPTRSAPVATIEVG